MVYRRRVYSRKSRKTAKRKQYRYRKRARGSTTIPQIYKPYNRMSNAVFPVKYCTKLKYSEAFTINPVVAGAGVYPFRANSVYDPNASAGGHQAHGFDTLMTIYQHYTVIASKITFRVAIPANNSQPFILGIHLDDEGTLTEGGNVTALMEQPRTNRKLISNPPSATGKELQISHKFSAKKFFGVKSIVAIDEYEGNVSSNPQEEAYFMPFIAPLDATSDLAAYNCFAEIEYVVVFTEPKDLLQS